jgi:hypothetical protein
LNSPPPKPEVILTNFFAEPTVLLVPITSREKAKQNGRSFKNTWGRETKMTNSSSFNFISS